jgi:AcrR family transcriptional regulator
MKKGNSKRFTKNQWLEASFEVLSKEGHAKIHIEHLANNLGTTKGSFYWHFKDRNDFLLSMADYWVKTANKQVIEAVQKVKGDAKTRLLALMETISRKELQKHDLPMRALGIKYPKIAKIVKKVDNQRLDFVRRIFAEMGFKGEELEMRTRAFVCTYAGEHVFFVKEKIKNLQNRRKLKHAFFTRK